MTHKFLAKVVGINLMIATVIFSLTACDLLSKKPQTAFRTL